MSQKLIVRYPRFREFWYSKWCVKTDVYGTVLLQQHHLPRKDEIACLEMVPKYYSYQIISVITLVAANPPVDSKSVCTTSTASLLYWTSTLSVNLKSLAGESVMIAPLYSKLYPSRSRNSACSLTLCQVF